MKKIFYLLTIISVFAISCQKEDNISQEQLKPMSFITSDAVATKSTSLLTNGTKTTAYAVVTATAPNSFMPGTPLELTAEAGGVLTPAAPLYLEKGTYDFYSVSANTASSPSLTFTSGISNQLTNNVDYLWAKASAVNNGGVVNFQYKHRSVGLEAVINAGEGITDLVVKSIKITPSLSSTETKMNLETGVITPASSVAALTAMQVTANKGKYIMLPLTSNALSIEIIIDGKVGSTTVTNKVYTGTIPAQAYLQGNYYTVNLTVSTSALSFSGTVVEDWTSQTISPINLIEQ